GVVGIGRAGLQQVAEVEPSRIATAKPTTAKAVEPAGATKPTHHLSERVRARRASRKKHFVDDPSDVAGIGERNRIDPQLGLLLLHA
ncbi:hypothetical protein ACS22S_27520, partial [Klebsiella pneumoniae]|uniref:hypothetical protein n=1 Tax=Klebsiella pneumoniae TaxID=573 RepID=UPI003F1EF23D